MEVSTPRATGDPARVERDSAIDAAGRLSRHHVADRRRVAPRSPSARWSSRLSSSRPSSSRLARASLPPVPRKESGHVSARLIGPASADSCAPRRLSRASSSRHDRIRQVRMGAGSCPYTRRSTERTIDLGGRSAPRYPQSNTRLSAVCGIFGAAAEYSAASAPPL
jgi:hypothetical protein